MEDDKWSWHDAKARKNAREHRVTFEQAKAVFGDLAADQVVDDREDYGEERINITGRDGSGNLLVVTYTMRAWRKHLISARKATTNEQDEFYSAIGGNG